VSTRITASSFFGRARGLIDHVANSSVRHGIGLEGCPSNVAVFDGASKQEKVVTRACIAVLLMLIAVFLASASAQQPQEQSDAYRAKAMLLRASIAVKADKDTALRKFTAGEDGFRDRDIYPYCFTLKDGVVVTGQTRGNDIRTLKDPTGKVFGREIFDAAQKPEGEVTVGTWPRGRAPTEPRLQR
jgi:hypothetical protein